MAYLTGAVEYTDCILQRSKTRYDTKQFDGETPVLELLWDVEYPFIAIAPRSTLTQNGSNRNVWHLNCMETNDLLIWIVRNRAVWPFNYV